MDWLKGKSTGNHGLLPSNIGFSGFPVNCPIQFYESKKMKQRGLQRVLVGNLWMAMTHFARSFKIMVGPVPLSRVRFWNAVEILTRDGQKNWKTEKDIERFFFRLISCTWNSWDYCTLFQIQGVFLNPSANVPLQWIFRLAPPSPSHYDHKPASRYSLLAGPSEHTRLVLLQNTF